MMDMKWGRGEGREGLHLLSEVLFCSVIDAGVEQLVAQRSGGSG